MLAGVGEFVRNPIWVVHGCCRLCATNRCKFKAPGGHQWLTDVRYHHLFLEEPIRETLP